MTPDQVAAAIARHRRNAERRHEACEHWGTASSVSRVVLGAAPARLDLAVKWNHRRGLRRALSEGLFGSRAARAAAAAARLGAVGIRHPETLAVVERRRLGVVVESFLVTRFLDAAVPLPAAMPRLRVDRSTRRASAGELGRVIGRLHASGLDHPDLKHTNLMLGEDGRITLLDLDALRRVRAPGWRGRVRALGQLEAYASDLYPWLPRSERSRFLRAYLHEQPRLAPRRRELLRAVRSWVTHQLARWAREDRRYHYAYPLGPRPPGTREAPGSPLQATPPDSAPAGSRDPAG